MAKEENILITHGTDTITETGRYLASFDLNKIMVSGGSACSSGTLHQSRVLRAMQVKADFINGAIRISLGINNNAEEIDKFIEVWKKSLLKY